MDLQRVGLGRFTRLRVNLSQDGLTKGAMFTCTVTTRRGDHQEETGR